MTPEIIRLLELRPDADFRAIRKAYKKRRREIDPLNTSELERLDAAYTEAMKQKRSAGYSDEQISAMRFLGIVPGCSLKTAIKFARNNGLDETEIQTAAGILEPVMPKVSVKDIALAVLRAVLAWLPVLLARPLYLMIQKSGVNLFPGHSDPELAEWFSGTLTASVTVSILFTITVPLLAFFLWKKVRARKRLFRKLGVRPGAESQVHDLLAELNIFFFCAALAISTYGPGFYRNAGKYLADYRAMKSETYLSAQIFAPAYAAGNYRYDVMGRVITDGDGLVLDVRDELYDNRTSSYVHEATYRYLPHTKLVHEMEVKCRRLADLETKSLAEKDHFRQLLIDEILKYTHSAPYTQISPSNIDAAYFFRCILEGRWPSYNVQDYIWYDEQLEQYRGMISFVDGETGAEKVATFVMNKDGRTLHGHILTGMQIGEAFLLDNGDVILYVLNTPDSTFRFGAEVQAVHLNGEDLSMISQSESIQISPHDMTDFGKVGTDGINVTVGKSVNLLNPREHYFIPLP